MKTCTSIGTTIQAHANAAQAKDTLAAAEQEPQALLRTLGEFAGAELSGKDLVAIWNALPDVGPKKFTSRTPQPNATPQFSGHSSDVVETSQRR